MKKLASDHIAPYKPYLVVQLDAPKVIKQDRVLDWLSEQEIKVLTIAGPRESKYPGGIYNDARHYLQALFSLARDRTDSI
jgi:ABC-type hemin transport system substrate-binding protein